MILTLNKKDIMNEAAQTTAYAGAKIGEYYAIGITGADAPMLERFWLESRNAICRALRHILEKESLDDSQLTLKLKTSQAYDTTLANSIQSSLRSYCVLAIVSKWLTLCQNGAAADYGSVAASMLDDALRILTHKRQPQRPNALN